MLKVRSIFTISLAAMCLLICAAGVNAALVRTDLLGGFGDFEFSADTIWEMATSGSWPGGVKPATPDDSVAAEWCGFTGYGVVREQNAIYRIAPGKGINGSNCQYLALKNVGSATMSTYLRIQMVIRDDNPSEVHHGDQLAFRLDRLFMSGYNLPGGAWVRYRVTINYAVPGMPDINVSIDLTPSATPFSAEVTAPVVPNANAVRLMVEVTAGGNIGTATPGIYVDGARLYRKSPGNSSYDVEQVPVPRNRAIKSHMIFFQSQVHDPCEVATDYDSVMLQYESDYAWALRLKYYNPSIKVFLYESAGWVTDWRDQNRIDSPYSNSPLGFGFVLAEHIDWLYPWPAGYTPVVDNREPWLRDANCLTDPDYPNGYYTHVDNGDYQLQWGAAAADKATRYRLDGVFVDTLGTIQSTADAPVSRTEAEVQSFLHGVCPYLHQAGLQVSMNCCTGILGQSPANIYFDPKWKTNSTYPPSRDYENNTPDKTPDTFFQEWAFFKHWPSNGADMNHYDVGYWDGSLANLDAMVTWNRSLPTGSKKSIIALTDGVDRPEDPALGLDGWVHFALCSFMLAQNQYTSLGACSMNAAVDLSGTVRLGDPTTNRGLLASDRSLQMRMYKNGLVIVNGHPTTVRTYRIPAKMIDENGGVVAAGKTISLRPHTGRMYFYK